MGHSAHKRPDRSHDDNYRDNAERQSAKSMPHHCWSLRRFCAISWQKVLCDLFRSQTLAKESLSQVAAIPSSPCNSQRCCTLNLQHRLFIERFLFQHFLRGLSLQTLQCWSKANKMTRAPCAHCLQDCLALPVCESDQLLRCPRGLVLKPLGRPNLLDTSSLSTS